MEEFQGWEEQHRGTLSELISKYRALAGVRRNDKEKALRELPAFLPRLFKTTEFLTHYALVGIATIPSDTDAPCPAWVFRGKDPSPVALKADVPLRPHDLYLLSLDRRQALLLDPGVRFFAEKSMTDLWGISGLKFEPDDGAVIYENFVQRDRFTSEDGMLCAREQFARWLGPALAKSLFQIECSAPVPARVGRVFDEGSWQLIQKLCLPDDQGELMFVGGYKLFPPSFHRGKYADLYVAQDESRPECSAAGGGPNTERAAIHILHMEHAKDSAIRSWFHSRSDAWGAIRHPAVVPLLSKRSQSADDASAVSKAGGPIGDGPPYLAAEHIPDATTLAAKLETSGTLPEELCRSILEAAAEVCLEAHRQNIYLMALPPHHFLIDRQAGIHLTGFEAALSETNPLWKQMTAPDYFSKFTRQRNSIDPAVLSGRMQPGPLADVYALGVLLAALRGVPAQPAEHLPASAWTDPWQCLAFHSLAARPNLRFQSPEHFLRAMREWLKRTPGDPPELVHVPAGQLDASVARTPEQPHVPGFWISKYPVTNAEFTFFCMKSRPRPQYNLEAEYLRDQDRLALAGPWCPVTHVCLDHAELYCDWLGQRTGRRWRLPVEFEWSRAALLEGNGPYPWGASKPERRHANYDRFFTSPTVVGAFPEGRSAKGCYDMAGNVWEWCSDFVSEHEPLRVLKGGAYDFSADCLKVPSRQGVVVLYRSAHAGFRVVCEENPGE